MSVLKFLSRPAVLLAFGLGVSAAAGSGFLAILNRSVSSPDVVALSGLNFLLATISTGVMAGLEQEMTRAVSRALALGASVASVVRRQARQSAWLIAGTMAVVGALAPVLVAHWLGGRWYLYGELLLGLFGALVSFQVRGLLSGRQDFHNYSLTLIVEGLTRLVPSILILALGVGTAWMFGLLFALGPVLAALSGIVGPRLSRRQTAMDADAAAPAQHQTQDPEQTPEPEQQPDDSSLPAAESSRRAASNLALLTGATLASQLLMNSVPLLVVARYSGNRDHKVVDQAAAINSAVGLTRLGILALFPLQAPLLPRLTAAATRGDLAEVRKRTLLLLGLCAAVGLAGVGACFAVGPWLMHTIMGAHAPLPRGFLAAFAGGTLFLMLAFILQSALIALGHHRMVMIAWGLGVVVTVPVFAVSSAILTTTAAAALVGPLLTAVLMAVDLQWATRSRRPRAGGAVPAPPVKAGRSL